MFKLSGKYYNELSMLKSKFYLITSSLYYKNQKNHCKKIDKMTEYQ